MLAFLSKQPFLRPDVAATYLGLKLSLQLQQADLWEMVLAKELNASIQSLDDVWALHGTVATKSASPRPVHAPTYPEEPFNEGAEGAGRARDRFWAPRFNLGEPKSDSRVRDLNDGRVLVLDERNLPQPLSGIFDIFFAGDWEYVFANYRNKRVDLPWLPLMQVFGTYVWSPSQLGEAWQLMEDSESHPFQLPAVGVPEHASVGFRRDELDRFAAQIAVDADVDAGLSRSAVLLIVGAMLESMASRGIVRKQILEDFRKTGIRGLKGRTVDGCFADAIKHYDVALKSVEP